MARTLIESIAQKLRIIPDLDREYSSPETTDLRKFPDPEAVSYTHLTLPTKA